MQKHNLGRRRWLVFSLVGALLGSSLGGAALIAQDESSGEPMQRQVIRRLPNYFAAVVTPQQREEIYEIQERFNTQIHELREQIERLEAERNALVDGVLTEEQLAEVNARRDAARQRLQATAGGRAQAPMSEEGTSEEDESEESGDDDG